MWFSLTWRNRIRKRKTKKKMCVKQNERVLVDVAQQELAPLSAKLDQCLRLILRFLAIFFHWSSIYCDKYIVSITPYFFLVRLQFFCSDSFVWHCKRQTIIIQFEHRFFFFFDVSSRTKIYLTCPIGISGMTHYIKIDCL